MWPPKTEQVAAATSSGGAATTSSKGYRRGRPPGAKNKPKPPIIITRDNPHALQPQVLEVSAGADILESVTNYARRSRRGVCILSGSGTVVDVKLSQQAAAAPSGSCIVTLQGKFEILKLSGTILPPPAPPGVGGLSIFLSGGRGVQVIGGSVVSPLVASSPVVLMTASFSNVVLERLPLKEEEAQGSSQVQQIASLSSSVTTGGGGVSFINMSPIFRSNRFLGDMFGWDGNAFRPPF